MSGRPLGFRVLLAWGLVGMFVGTLVQVVHLRDVDWDLVAALRVGAESETRHVIVDELGTVPVTRGTGHDGQYFYLIARDPWATEGYADLTDDGGYRFRRPLYGWLAGGFGALGPRPTLVGLSVWAIVGLALATAATADVVAQLGGRLWGMIGVVANLGLWLSVQLVTADALATGLAMLAVALALRNRSGWGAVALAGAALAKETFVLFAIGLAIWSWLRKDRKAAVSYLIVPAVSLGTWIAWLETQVGGALSPKSNFSLPFLGIIEAVPDWTNSSEVAHALVAGGSLVIAAAGMLVVRNRLLTWLTIPWVSVAVVSSAVVWAGANNAVRAFAPAWLLGWLSWAVFAQRRNTGRAVVS